MSKNVKKWNEGGLNHTSILDELGIGMHWIFSPFKGTQHGGASPTQSLAQLFLSFPHFCLWKSWRNVFSLMEIQTVVLGLWEKICTLRHVLCSCCDGVLSDPQDQRKNVDFANSEWRTVVWCNFLPSCVSDERRTVRTCQRMWLFCRVLCWVREVNAAHHVSSSLPAGSPRPHPELRGEELYTTKQEFHASSQERLLLFLLPARQPAGKTQASFEKFCRKHNKLHLTMDYLIL